MDVQHKLNVKTQRGQENEDRKHTNKQYSANFYHTVHKRGLSFACNPGANNTVLRKNTNGITLKNTCSFCLWYAIHFISKSPLAVKFWL